MSANIHLKEILNGGLLVFGSKIIGTAIGFFTTLIIGRTYGADSLGSITIIASALNICSTIALFGLNIAALRLFTESMESNSAPSVTNVYKESTKIIICGTIMISLLLIATSRYWLPFLNDGEQNETLLKSAALILLANTFLVYHLDILRAIRKHNLFAYSQLVTPVIMLVALLSFPLVIDSPEIPKYALFTSIIISGLLVTGIAILQLARLPDPIDNRRSSIRWTRLMQISLPMHYSTLIFVLMSQIDVIIVGIIVGKEQAGVYAAAIKLSIVSNFIIYSINTIAAPKFAQLNMAKDKASLALTAQGVTRLMFYSTLPINLIYLIFGAVILKLFGEGFSNGYTTLCVLAIGQIINAASGPVGSLLNMTGHERKLQNIVFVSGILNITLNVLLIPFLGILGAAIANLVTVTTWNVWSAVYIHRVEGFHVWARRARQG